MISLSSGSLLEQQGAKPPKSAGPRASLGPITPVPQVVVAGLPVEEEVICHSPEKILPQKSILGSLRKYISGSRSRYIEKGFDLDLSYITPRIIAMGFPAKGLESAYRNPRLHVVSFLKNTHRNRYLVFNLCAEEKHMYDPLVFAHPHAPHGAVSIPIWDHTPPSLCQIALFVQRGLAWLNQHPDNVVVVHCLAGKGRTGVMISALLLASRVCSSASEALLFFSENRGGVGVNIPSQIRWVKLFEEMLIHSGNSIPIAITALSVCAHNVWSLEYVEVLGTTHHIQSVKIRPRSSLVYTKVALPLLPQPVVDLRGAQFTCNEDAEFSIKIQGKIKFWLCSEMTQTMLNHRISIANESTVILTKEDLDYAKGDLVVKIHIRFHKQ